MSIWIWVLLLVAWAIVGAVAFIAVALWTGGKGRQPPAWLRYPMIALAGPLVWAFLAFLVFVGGCSARNSRRWMISGRRTMSDPRSTKRTGLSLWWVWAWALSVIALLVLPAWWTSAEAQQIPALAKQHQRELTRIVQQEWGLGGSVARAAAQIHQESGWRADVADGRTKSWAGAEGLAQFMPTTATWIVEIYPDLGEAAPFTPSWAFRAMARYDGWLFARVEGHTQCDKWWHTLRAYNGGLGHLRNESRNATDPDDRHATDAACGTGRRSATHCPENLGYPRRILLEIEPRYLRAGWQGRPTCPGDA